MSKRCVHTFLYCTFASIYLFEPSVVSILLFFNTSTVRSLMGGDSRTMCKLEFGIWKIWRENWTAWEEIMMMIHCVIYIDLSFDVLENSLDSIMLINILCVE